MVEKSRPILPTNANWAEICVTDHGHIVGLKDAKFKEVGANCLAYGSLGWF